MAIRVSKRHSAIRRAGASAWTAHCRPRGAAIPSKEDAISLEAAIAMRARFAQDSPSVRVLFDALVKLLTGVGQKHYRWRRRVLRVRVWPSHSISCPTGSRSRDSLLPRHRSLPQCGAWRYGRSSPACSTEFEQSIASHSRGGTVAAQSENGRTRRSCRVRCVAIGSTPARSSDVHNECGKRGCSLGSPIAHLCVLGKSGNATVTSSRAP